MYDAQMIGSHIIIGILIYSVVIHGMVYVRLRSYVVHGVFAAVCLFIAGYTATNVISLYHTSDLAAYIWVSKISSIFVIVAIVAIAWFAAEFLHDYNNIPVKMIAITLTPFFIINLIMENGILWSSIEGVEVVSRRWGISINRPLNPVVSWPMYGLWFVIAAVYLILVRASYLSLRRSHRKRGLFLFVSILMLTASFIFDMLIDLGINKSYFYISEYMVLVFVVLMSLHLSDELRAYALRLESLVAKRTKALQHANRELESFSYSISHDLRAPLRAIQGFTSVLKEDYSSSLDKQALSFMEKINSSVKRMQTMIEGLLNLSKISQEKIERRELNVSELASDIVKELRDKDSDRQVDVFIEPDMECYCDPSLVRILLENLINNAWKYTGNVKEPEIRVGTFINDTGRLGFFVSDNGAGFDQKYAEKLFMPFQRLHASEEFPGIGIGLATVARIVNRHEGKIWAESKIGEGATFYFELE